MLDKAIEKLKKEMEQHKNNGYVQYVGQSLIEYIKKDPAAAAIINAATDKSIIKSLDAMEAEARKMPRTGNVVMLTPDEGMKVVLKYFGIIEPQIMPSQGQVNTIAEKSSTGSEFDIKLEDLL